MRSTSLSRALSPIAITLAFAASGAAQVARPDFSGRWTFDAEASSVGGGGRGDGTGRASGGGGGTGGGTGLGRPADELTLEQNDSVLIMGARRQAVVDTIRYRLDGKTVENVMPVGRGATTHANYTSRWNRERLETTIARKVGTRVTRYRELLYLSADSTLVLETNVVGVPSGRKAIYRRTK